METYFIRWQGLKAQGETFIQNIYHKMFVFLLLLFLLYSHYKEAQVVGLLQLFGTDAVGI